MIKNVSNTYKSNCKKDSVKYREYIIIDNKEVDIKGNLSDTAYKDTTFFGKFNLKMLKFETENDIDYKKKEFTYYKEVDGEALKIGTFIVTEVKDSDTFESVNVTAYDYGLKFANPYITSLDYSNTTLFQVIQEICMNCGVELENTSLPNGTFIVDSNQFVNGEQYGDVVAQASAINGMFATINSNDKLEFIFTNETNEIIEDYVELDDKRDTQPITSVLVATSEDLETAGAVKKDQSLIEQYGEHWLKIYSYGFAYSTIKCQQLVEAIFNQVKGFGYSSFKSEYSFLPYLSLGDKIKFKTKDGKIVDSIILKYETSYDEITFEAPSIINTAVDYELPETPENIAKKAMIKVNQIDGEVIINTKQINEIGEKLNNNYYEKEQVNQLVQSAENGLINTFTSSGGNNLLRNTAPWYMKSENTAEFWNGNLKQIVEPEATSGYAILIQNGTISQNVSLPTGTYSVSFKYKKLINASEGYVRYNGKTFNLTETSGEIHSSGKITNNQFVIEINSNTNDSFEIYDLILKHGSEGLENILVWTQNANESRSDTVQISEGITATSSVTDTKATMDGAGFIVRNKTTGTSVMEATKTGGKFLDLISTGKSNLSGLLVQKVGLKICINGESGS